MLNAWKHTEESEGVSEWDEMDVGGGSADAAMSPSSLFLYVATFGGKKGTLWEVKREKKQVKRES